MSIMNMTDSSKRFSILVLPYEMKDLSVAKEMIVDYDTGHIYVRDKHGVNIISITKELENKIVQITNSGGDNITVINPEDKTEGILNTVLDNIYQYINAAVQGLSVKYPVRVLSDSNIPSLFGIPTSPIDGVTLIDGDEILLIGQEDKVLNGKWIVKADANWERSKDLNEESELLHSAFLFVLDGEKYKETGWILVTDNPIIGHDELEWQIFTRADEILAGAGLVKKGNEIALAECVTKGSSTKVRWDEYGRIISYENPTTLAEYNITDAVSVSHIGSSGNQHGIVTHDYHGFSSKEDKKVLDSIIPTIEQVELETNIKMDTKSEIEFIGEEPISITLDDTLEIVDNLNSQSSTKALSARQGNTIKQLIDNVFTNANTSKYTKLWMGTLDQYYSLERKDNITLYIATDNVEELEPLTDLSLEQILIIIQEMRLSMFHNTGGLISGDVTIGTTLQNNNLNLYGGLYINGKSLNELYAPIDHTHDNILDKIQFDKALEKKADVAHEHKIKNISGLQVQLDSKANSDHTHNFDYYNREQIDDKLAKRSALVHEHKASDIIDLIDLIGDGIKTLHLKNIEQDTAHRTVGDSQITRWDEVAEAFESGKLGGNIGDITLEHNTDPSSHKDIRDYLTTILNQMGYNALLSGKTIKDTINDLLLGNVFGNGASNFSFSMKKYTNTVNIISNNTKIIRIGITEFNSSSTLLVFRNGSLLHDKIDYIIDGNNVILTKTINNGNAIHFVCLNLVGSIVNSGDGGGSTPNITIINGEYTIESTELESFTVTNIDESCYINIITDSNLTLIKGVNYEIDYENNTINLLNLFPVGDTLYYSMVYNMSSSIKNGTYTIESEALETFTVPKIDAKSYIQIVADSNLVLIEGLNYTVNYTSNTISLLNTYEVGEVLYYTIASEIIPTRNTTTSRSVYTKDEIDNKMPQFVRLTKEEYDLLEYKDPNTLYAIQKEG